VKTPNQFIFEFICTEWHYTAVLNIKYWKQNCWIRIQTPVNMR